MRITLFLVYSAALAAAAPADEPSSGAGDRKVSVPIAWET